jgi:hypothetical protein
VSNRNWPVIAWSDVEGLQGAAANLLNHLEAHFRATDAPTIRLVNNFCESA